jgi:hypothetical protein
VEPDSVIAPALVTAWVGSLVAVSRLENVGVAKVGGFYRFPPFGFCKAERCQQDYSAMKATWLKSKLAKEHAMPLARRSLLFCAAGAALLARLGLPRNYNQSTKFNAIPLTPL